MNPFVQFVRSQQLLPLLHGNWLSTEEAAQRVNYTASNIRKLIRNNHLDVVTIPKYGYLVSEASLDFFVKRKQAHE